MARKPVEMPPHRTPNRMAGIGTARGWITIKPLGLMPG
jgi:hypothetical protein